MPHNAPFLPSALARCAPAQHTEARSEAPSGACPAPVERA